VKNSRSLRRNVVYDNGQWRVVHFSILKLSEVIHNRCHHVAVYDPDRDYYICPTCGYYTRDDGLLCTALLLHCSRYHYSLEGIYKNLTPKEDVWET
jgi:hypothetical protein